MKKLWLRLSAMFFALTFIGVGYVLVKHGEVSAGYAVLPMLFTLVCLDLFKK